MRTHAQPSVTRFAKSMTIGLLVLCWVTVGGSSRAADDRTSPDGVWQRTEIQAVSGALTALMGGPSQYSVFTADKPMLGTILERAPMEFTGAAQQMLTLPLPDGRFARFAINESPILSPELQQGHPDIKTYSGQGIDDPTATVRFDVTRFGFRAMILSSAGTVMIDPLYPGRTEYLMSYYKRDVPRTDDFICEVTGETVSALSSEPQGLMVASGDQLTTYRTVVTVTGEYTEHWANIAGATTRADSIAAAVAQITTTFNRVTGIYENDVAVRFNITKTIVFVNTATDRFPNGAGVSELNDSNVVICNDSVGLANFDIGHILSQGGSGGIAGLGVVCGDWKAWGGTSRGNPSGDWFDVDYVAHEVGHQMGGDHTFNGTTGSCGGGNRSADNAYEPGSGSTIQAYAGICGAEDLQPHSDPYFHVRSLEQIIAKRNSGGCGTVTNTGNSAPSANAGPDYTIPRGTSFTLHGSGGDPDGHPLTYCWEQYDLGAATPPNNMADGPLFRSLSPTTDPSRTLPKWSTILAGTTDKWERLPTVDRTLTWKLSVRDNRAGGGGVDWDEMVITVAGDPFAITYPNGGGTVTSGCSGTITWNVGGGSVATHVKISLSTDGGQNWTTLMANTPNDGSATVTWPCTPTEDARIMIEANGNIFFDVSDSDFEIALPTITTTLSSSFETVDDTCGAVVSFSGTVANNCAIDPDDIDVSATLLDANAVLSGLSFNAVNNGATIDVTGTVFVSSLTSSPARVRIAMDVSATCGVTKSDQVTVNVTDDTPATPSVTASGGPVDANCEATVTFSGSVVDNCFVEANGITVTASVISGATGSNLVVNKNQIGDRRVDFTGSYLISDLLTSPVGIEVTVTAIDGGGNVSSARDTAWVTDPIPLTVSANATGGYVDESCEFVVNFSGSAGDNCPLDPADVLVDVTLPSGNASLGTPLLNINAIDAYSVSVTGSVLVYGLMGSPAVVNVTITATDAGGHTESDSAKAEVWDTIPPVITCPNDIVAEFTSPTEASVFFEATATDNCDGDPTIVYSIDPGSIFAIGAHTIMCIATDDSENADTCYFTFELVPLDIKPRSCPNPLNVNGAGVTPTAAGVRPEHVGSVSILPTAILGTETFDVGTIDFATVMLEGIAPERWALDDVASPVDDDTTQSCECTTAAGDGFEDVVLMFQKGEIVATLGAVEHNDELMLTITGRLLDGTPFAGGDCVIIRNSPGNGKPGPVSVNRGTAVLDIANYPNPFNAATVIRYNLPVEAHVTIEVFDILGRRIRTLAEGIQPAGLREVTWNGRSGANVSVASGMYFYRITAGDQTITRKMLLLK